MRKILYLSLLIFYTAIPNVFAQASSEDIENWFDDNYWAEKFAIFDDSLCDFQQSYKKDTEIINCNKEKERSQIKLDADFLRKYKCDDFIKNDFNTNTFIKVSNDIKNDCKRIFNTYKFDSNFDDEYFSPEYISFAIGKKLPFYEGEFNNGLKHGEGIEYFKNGIIYSGKFINGKRNGKGIFIWPDGDRYEGEFKDGLRDGKGTYYYSNRNGARYIGEFVKGKFGGFGKFIYQSGDIYEGELKDGNRDGKGTYIFSNGQKYIGYWLKGKRNGEGILYDKNKKIFKQGLWENGKLVRSQNIDLEQIDKSNRSETYANNSNHESCLKAADYEGCMNFQLGINSNSNYRKKDDIDCVNYVCSPEDAKIYGTDNLGLKLFPGYYFTDNPSRRAAYFWSKPLKLNVNGNYGRYIHIQGIIRYYSEGYSGSITTNPGIGEGATPRINYNPGQPAGVRQIVYNHIFDCEEKMAADFKGNRLVRTETKSGRKKKWFSFEEAQGYAKRKGIEGCRKSKNYIMSLNISPFDKFHKKELKNTPKNKNPKINCNSPVYRNKPICN